MFSGKVIIILGSRQAGKTTIIKKLSNLVKQKQMFLNGDDPAVRQMLNNPTFSQLKQIVGNNKVIFIDEAQRIENIGVTLKMIVDEMKGVQVVATGSSAFELANIINEPLTGRKWEYLLFPMSFAEMVNHTSFWEEFQNLEQRLIYGYYPEVVTSAGNQVEILKLISDSYLYKDILILDNIKKSNKIEKLLQALALQVGQQVSYNELAQLIGLDKATVEKYIRLLEQAFVIFRLPTLNRNLRNELKRTRKVYFYDNGVRNAILNNFNMLSLRQDIGGLWENFLISERMKYNHYNGNYSNYYFWRNHAQQEVDFIEEREGKLFAFEFKWNPRRKVKFPKSFIEGYPGTETKVISQENFTEFIMD
ncbi:MAG: ATP-binding protein [Salinivirgaceae bacterium]|nr:ATP-binding protein [Salinivirgaceae bacterium]